MSDLAGRWNEVSAQFDRLVELHAGERDAALAALRADDPALAAEVAALLVADAQENDLLDGARAGMPEVVAHEEAGERLAGPYRLLRVIGEGGMGVVWLGERVDGTFERQVAVKVLKPGMDSHAILRRFLLERRILARLAHRHIVRLLDGGSDDRGRPYYVMEYVDGRPLTEYAAAAQLDVRARVELLASVADAVAYAHSQLVVHRDLKPSNILVDASGEPRVLDFGIAKLVEDSAEQTQTRTGLRVLSPAYAAPEQILGEPIGTATDVYALGLVLCELLVGALPLKRRTSTPAQFAQDAAGNTAERASTLAKRLDDVRCRQLYGAAVDARRLEQLVAGDLDLIIATALQREPQRRYATAAALADDLRRWLGQRPIAARADSAAYRFTRFVRRHRVGVAAAAVAASSLVAGFGIALWQAHAARVAGERARAQAAIATAVSDFLARDVIEAVNPFRNKLDIRLADALIAAGPRIESRFAGKPRLAGVVRRELAESLYLAGAIDEAHAQAQLALEGLASAFGAGDADALEARVVLGRILLAQDDYDGARALYASGLAALGTESAARTRLALAVGLAGADVEQRKESDALRALDALAPQVEAEVGAFEPLHIEALNHRLRALVNIERYDEALALARRLRAGTEAKFGAGDPQTLDWVKREAIVLVDMERYDEALPIMEKACAATRTAFGDAHFATQDCNLRLGVVLFEKRRFADTVPLFEGVAAYREKTLGLDSEKTWIGWVWLARAYQYTDRRADARALFERAYANATRVNGRDHRNAMPFGQTLGMFFEQTGDHAAAETLRRTLLASARTAYPEGHINVAKYAWDLGQTLAAQQRDADTVAFFDEWLPQWDSRFPADDSRRIDAHKWFDAARQRLAARAAGGAQRD